MQNTTPNKNIAAGNASQKLLVQWKVLERLFPELCDVVCLSEVDLYTNADVLCKFKGEHHFLEHKGIAQEFGEYSDGIYFDVILQSEWQYTRLKGLNQKGLISIHYAASNTVVLVGFDSLVEVGVYTNGKKMKRLGYKWSDVVAIKPSALNQQELEHYRLLYQEELAKQS